MCRKSHGPWGWPPAPLQLASCHRPGNAVVQPFANACPRVQSSHLRLLDLCGRDAAAESTTPLTLVDQANQAAAAPCTCLGHGFYAVRCVNTVFELRQLACLRVAT
jgi:hypothetical protein